MRRKGVWWIGSGLVIVCGVCWAAEASGQSDTANGEWRSRGGDLANRRYAPLARINAENFSELETVWRFKTDNLGPRADYNLQATPLMVGGTLYMTAGARRSVVALDAATGELLWVYRLDEGERGEVSTRRGSGRGVAYWTDGREARIVYVTPGYRLVALEAATGRPVPTFGDNGMIDLRLEADQPLDPVTGDIALRTPPVVAGDTIIVGASHGSGQSRDLNMSGPKGHVRAYDARTGKRLWIFHTIPMADEYGADTWLGDSRAYTGNAGVWAQITVDLELGHVYLPTESATGDHYGGHRPGDNLFSDTLVAVDLETGHRIWHYQFIHHDIWDYDLPCGPILADVTVDGRPLKVIAQPTKQSWLYVFDRETGEPIWPIEERPVEAGGVPGEWYAGTQPFPTWPPPYDRQGVSLDDLIDFTPELRARAEEIVSHYELGPIFTPPVVSRPEGPYGTLTLPNIAGGANWPGGSLDPETGILYIGSRTDPMSIGVIEADPERSDMSYVVGTAAPAPEVDAGAGALAALRLEVDGLPLTKPPYTRLTAIDLNTGAIVWQVAHGETPDAIRNHPALREFDVPRTGSTDGRAPGTLVTKTLLIAGEAQVTTMPDGRRGAMLRAYDKGTGAEVGAVYLPAGVTGPAMTYEVDGEQHLTVAVGGPGYTAELRTLKLPAP